MSAPSQAGMMATRRNRRGLMAAVAPGHGRSARTFHLCSVEYVDAEASPNQLLPQPEQQLGATTRTPYRHAGERQR